MTKQWKDTKASLETKIDKLEDLVTLQSNALRTASNRTNLLEDQVSKLIDCLHRSI